MIGPKHITLLKSALPSLATFGKICCCCFNYLNVLNLLGILLENDFWTPPLRPVARGGSKGAGAPPFLLKGGCNDEFAPHHSPI